MSGGAHRRPPPPLRVRDAAGALALAATVAVSHPLLDLLSRNTEFFVARQAQPADVLAFVLAAGLGVPVLAALLAGLLRWWPRLGRVVVAIVLAVLLGLAVVPVVERLAAPGPALALAAVTGAGLAAAVLRWEPLRTLQRWGVVLPLVVVVLTLVASPLSGLALRGQTAVAAGRRIRNPVPLVLLVLDEFPVSSLMDADGDLDRVRYPNFARLLERFTWYRNTTSTHAHTHQVIPAMLTGGPWKPGADPVAAVYPDNLFTLLAGEYDDIVVREQVTWLCPPAVCETRARPLRERLAGFLSDGWVVAQHVVLPAPLTADLPPLDHGWTDFRGQQAADAPRDDLGHSPFSDLYRSSPATQATWPQFLASLEEGGGPRLRYFHALSPHRPFRWLPGPRAYNGSAADPNPGVWGEEQYQQRHLLQVGAADAALGELLDRLEARSWYDDALVFVLGDHGAAFGDGQPFRHATDDNLDALAWVPLFVKLPGQQRGGVDDRPASLSDVLPTIVDVLQVQHAGQLAGASLREPPQPERVRTFTSLEGRTWRLPPTWDGQRALLARKAELFGAAPGWDGVYHYGPHRELVGLAVADLPALPPAVGGGIADRDAYAAVDADAPVLPALVQGTIAGTAVDEHDWVAVELNGRIAAVGPVHGVADGDPRFAALVPPDAFVDGDNAIAVHRIVTGGGGVALQRVAG